MDPSSGGQALSRPNGGSTGRVELHRQLGPAVLALLAGLVLTLCGTLAACDNRAPACRPTPTCTPTPSAVAGLVLGKWVVKDGELAKSQIVLGEKVEFRANGTFSWEGKVGTYSIFRDETITLKRSAVGEAFEYYLVVSQDTLTMSRYTSCGKEDRYVLARAE